MSYKEDWTKIGYNQEELYFEKMNRELIHKIKSQTPETQNQGQMGHVIQFRSRAVTADIPTFKKVA